MLETRVSFLRIFTGEELRVSTPVKIASGLANPLSLVSKYLIPSNKVCETNLGKISFRFEKVTPGKYEGLIVPIKLEGLFNSKSSNL